MIVLECLKVGCIKWICLIVGLSSHSELALAGLNCLMIFNNWYILVDGFLTVRG